VRKEPGAWAPQDLFRLLLRRAASAWFLGLNRLDRELVCRRRPFGTSLKGMRAAHKDRVHGLTRGVPAASIGVGRRKPTGGEREGRAEGFKSDDGGNAFLVEHVT
jgi:hypothetical protein